jgi:hypothetical protein
MVLFKPSTLRARSALAEGLRATRRQLLLLAVLLLAGATARPAQAQEELPSTGEGPRWQAVAGASIFGLGCSSDGLPDARLFVQLPSLARLWRAPEPEPPPEPETPPDRAPLLLAHMLSFVTDGTGAPGWRENVDEVYAYNHVLYNAWKTPTQAFAKSARRDLSYAHLYQEPHKLRGEVVHVEGRLRRVLRFDPPATAWAKGVNDLYEGWILVENPDSAYVCVVFTELPEGVPLGQKLDLRVAFDGYLFKRYKYEPGLSTKPGESRQAPLLIGHGPVLAQVKNPTAGTWDWAYGIPAFIVIVVVAVVVLAIGLRWWFQRGDRKVRARLAEIACKNFLESGAAGPPAATEVRPTNGHASEELPSFFQERGPNG